MIITYFGDACFRLQSGEVSLLTNPTNNRLKADATLRTLIAPTVTPPSDEIVFPGEYEVGGIEIQGFAVSAESSEKYLKTIYLVKWEDMRFVFLGHLTGMPGDEIIEAISEPDVLFIPTGDHLMSGEDGAKLIKKLEPAIAIPSFFKTPSEFLKAVGQKVETEEKLVFKKKDLVNTKGRVVVLKANV